MRKDERGWDVEANRGMCKDERGWEVETKAEIENVKLLH